MSEHGHGAVETDGEPAHGDNHIQPVVWMFIALAIAVVCWQGYNVFSSGGDAHVWPAANAVKVDLPPSP